MTWSQVGNALNIPGIGGIPALAAMTSSRVAFIDGISENLTAY